MKFHDIPTQSNYLDGAFRGRHRFSGIYDLQCAQQNDHGQRNAR